MQAVVEGHETATSAAPGVGLGTWSTLHWTPFHRSARTEPPACPTALHTAAAGHDRPDSDAPSGSTGLVVAWRTQLELFVRHAAVILLPAASTDEPTAVHTVALGHDTPSRLPASGAVIVGAGAIAHDVPFHFSTSIRGRPSGVV